MLGLSGQLKVCIVFPDAKQMILNVIHPIQKCHVEDHKIVRVNYLIK
jgi:hypothetical protein